MKLDQLRFIFKGFLILSIFLCFLCFFSFIIFDRGLFFDGSHILFLITSYEDFNFYEISRKIFHFFQQLPVWLFINGTDSSSLTTFNKNILFWLDLDSYTLS